MRPLIPRVLSFLRTYGHPSRPDVAVRLQQPTRRHERAALGVFCLALLPMRLALQSLSPAIRWSLAPPFHPYLQTCVRRRSILCCAISQVTLGGRYPPSCSLEPGSSSTLKYQHRGHKEVSVDKDTASGALASLTDLVAMKAAGCRRGIMSLVIDDCLLNAW